MMAVAADREDLRRWAFSAAMIAGLHAALVLALIRWHEPITATKARKPSSSTSRPTRATTDSRNDLAPGPERRSRNRTPRSHRRPRILPPKSSSRCRPCRMLMFNCLRRPSRPRRPSSSRRRQCRRPRRRRGRGRPPRRLPPGIAGSRCRWNATKAIRLPRGRGMRRARPSSHSRWTGMARSWRAALPGHRALPRSIRKRSTRCGARSLFRHRRRTCPGKRSILRCPSGSTFADVVEDRPMISVRHLVSNNRIFGDSAGRHGVGLAELAC